MVALVYSLLPSSRYLINACMTTSVKHSPPSSPPDTKRHKLEETDDVSVGNVTSDDVNANLQRPTSIDAGDDGQRLTTDDADAISEQLTSSDDVIHQLSRADKDSLDDTVTLQLKTPIEEDENDNQVPLVQQEEKEALTLPGQVPDAEETTVGQLGKSPTTQTEEAAKAALAERRRLAKEEKEREMERETERQRLEEEERL